MGNKFDMISANPSGSINNLNLLNETFHVFSKSPASDTTTLGGARLKSGHTTTITDVWADEIPAFFSAANQDKFNLFSTLAVKDDLCIFGGKVYQHNGEQFVSLGTEAEILVDGTTFQKNNKDVIKYHKNRTAINLTADNNNGDGSNDLTAKIYDAATGSTNFVSQFISSTDKVVAGVPSLAYDATVIAGGIKLAEGLTNDNDYICNSYAGVIQFNKARSQGSVTVSAWEYIGSTLSDTVATKTDITNLENKIVDKIVDKTVRINPGTNNITVELTENPNAADSYTISVDGYTTDEIDALLENEADKIEEQIAIVAAATINTIEANKVAIENKLSSHASSNIHITADERSKWNTAVSKAAAAVQDVTSGNAYLERGTDNDNITLTLNVDTNLNDGGTANSVPSSTAVTNYGSSIISAHEAKKDEDKSIHVNSTDRDKWDTAATKAGNAIQTVELAGDSSLITVDRSGTSVSITLSDTIATKDELSSHTSDTDIHITTDERSKWDTASQKTDRLSFPTSYTNFNDDQCYVTSYGFEYVGLIEDAWIQNIEVNVALPELIDSVTEYNPISGGSPITPNIIGEKVCKILVTEGLNDDWGENFNKNDDEIELGVSEYNICKKDKNNSSIEILNFTFDQPIFLRANKNYRFYFYDQNENLYALPIMINVDNANNVTTIKKEVAIRCLIDRYDYAGVWNIDKDLLPNSYGLYGLKVKLSKDIYSAFIAHENNSNIHITENERERWDTAIQTVKRADDSSTLITVDQSETTVSVALSDTVATKTDITNLENKADKIEEQIAIVAAATVKTIDDNWNKSVKNISYLFDKGDGSPIALHGGKTISKYNDGTVTYVDNETTNFNVDDATIGIYTFRTDSDNTNWSSDRPDSLIEFNKREIISEGASPSFGDKPEFYYEYDAFDQNKYDIDYGQTTNSLSNLIVGRGMFTRSGLKIFNDNLSNLQDGFGMFNNSRNLAEFRSALPSLTVGSKMFLSCKKMTTFKTKLPNLSWAECMFKACDSLTTVDTCLPNLTYAQGFFGDCPNLTNITLSPNSCLCLYNADAMFFNCTSLTNLKINLSYLETGNQMFYNCKLNKESLEYIANNIREWPIDDPHPLGVVGYSCTEEEWTVIKKTFEDKGWLINAELDTNAINLTSENNILYAKVIYGPVYDKYIDSDNNKCDILIATKVKNVDEWKIVSSIEEAAQYYNLQLNTNNN